GRLARLAGTVAAGLALVLVAPASVAHAEPSVTEIEAQIAQAWNEAEPLIEQYDAVHEQYEQNLARQVELQAAIAALEAQLREAQSRGGASSAKAYRALSAGRLAVLLSSASPSDFADRYLYLDALSAGQASDVSDAIALKAQYDAQKAPIDQVVAQ